MQTYPCGGHKEHCHKVVEEDYKFKDDYSGHGGHKEHCHKVVEEDYTFKDDYQYYNKGSSMQVKPGQSNPPAKDNYNGYGGSDQKKYQCSETCYQKGQQHNSCNSKNDYSGYGGKHQNAKESQSVGLTLGVGLLKGLLNPLETTASVTLSKESSQCKTGK